MESVPVRTNEELRPSRLFHSMFGYVRRSMVTILRSYMMYKPMKFFGIIGGGVFALGTVLGLRFLYYFFLGDGAGHIQSLILCSTLILLGSETIILGFLASLIAANRKIMEDIQYRVKRLDYRNDNK